MTTKVAVIMKMIGIAKTKSINDNCNNNGDKHNDGITNKVGGSFMCRQNSRAEPPQMHEGRDMFVT